MKFTAYERKRIYLNDFLNEIHKYPGEGHIIEILDDENKILACFYYEWRWEIFQNECKACMEIDPVYEEISLTEFFHRYDKFLKGYNPGKVWRTEIYLFRVCYPYKLSEEDREYYFGVIKKNRIVAFQSAIANGLIHKLFSYPDLFLSRQNIDEIIELAEEEQNPELSGFLLNYKKEKFKAKDGKEFSLDLNAHGANDFKEVQKSWMITDLSPKGWTLSGYKGALTLRDEEKDRISEIFFPAHAGKNRIYKIGRFKCVRSEFIHKFNVSEGYEVISDHAFASLNFREIELPDSLEEIGCEAFIRCGDLEQVTFGTHSNLKSISASAFKYCRSLVRITIPENVQTIGEEAFYGCKQLKSVELGDGLAAIASLAFAYCPNLEELRIPAGVRQIAPDAFIKSGITCFTVDANNPAYYSEAGVIFNKETRAKVILPPGKKK